MRSEPIRVIVVLESVRHLNFMFMEETRSSIQNLKRTELVMGGLHGARDIRSDLVAEGWIFYWMLLAALRRSTIHHTNNVLLNPCQLSCNYGQLQQRIANSGNSAPLLSAGAAKHERCRRFKRHIACTWNRTNYQLPIFDYCSLFSKSLNQNIN